MRYGLLGEHLKHSFSKEIHEQINDYEYQLIEVAKNDLDEFMNKREFKAINVTIPYKEMVIPYLYYIDDNAKRIGAVNTIVNKDNKLYGYNTDYYGLRDLILKNEINVKDKKVLILGDGGASKCAQILVKDLSAKEVLVASLFPSDKTISYQDALDCDPNIIINATPCGMFPNNDDLIIKIDSFKNLEAIVDVIYNPLKTQLLLEGKKKGLKVCGGLYMLVSQAVYACGIFTDKEVDSTLIDPVYQNIINEKQNIVLIGMPSSGKSTIGKMLARRIKKDFIDTDKLIEAEIKMPIRDYIKEHGEESFRNVETKVIKEVAKLNNTVISTGGGVILREINMDALMKNGKVVFLNRSLSNLKPTKSRPLSSNQSDLEKLYNKRLPIYNKYADVIVCNNSSLEFAVEKIIEEVNK